VALDPIVQSTLSPRLDSSFRWNDTYYYQ